MRTLAFDQASNCGWAAWDGKSPAPQLGKHKVALWGVDDGAMLERFRRFLQRMLDEHQPEIMAIEGAAAGKHGDVSTMNRQAMIGGMIAWAAHCKQLPLYVVSPGTWRKSFIGFGARGKRINVDWKRLACQRATVLGWDFPDHNAAEAGAILDNVLFSQRGILTPWRENVEHWHPLPEIINAKSA